MQYQKTREESAIAYYTTDGVIRPEVQTITNIYRPTLQTEGYAPIPAGQKRDPLPLFIGGAFLLAFVVMLGIHIGDSQKRELQAQNAQLVAEANAIAGCVEGVRRGQ